MFVVVALFEGTGIAVWQIGQEDDDTFCYKEIHRLDGVYRNIRIYSTLYESEENMTDDMLNH